eukprot:3276910-Amphidinium_carterae.1
MQSTARRHLSIFHASVSTLKSLMGCPLGKTFPPCAWAGSLVVSNWCEDLNATACENVNSA